MNDDRDHDDSFSDLWIKNWEQQCIDHLESEPDYEGQVNNDRDSTSLKAWTSFQNAATSIAQLYKDRAHNVSALWLPFQTAAGTVTNLYKDSMDSVKRSGELGVQLGYQRRNKELLNWARKKRHNIRREELISYLAGKTLPTRPPSGFHKSTGRPLLYVSDRHSHTLPSEFHHLNINHYHHHKHHHMASPNANINPEDNLHMFKEALTYTDGGSRRQRSTELSAFVAGEYSRHCAAVKRQSSPINDVNMDSPTHPKRPRFL